MAMIGFPKSPSFIPVARQRARAPAMDRPWVLVALRYPDMSRWYPLGVDSAAIEAPRPLDDEVLARRDVAAHEQVEDPLGLLGVVDRDPAQGAVLRVHRRLGELVGVHLPEALVPLDVLACRACPLRRSEARVCWSSRSE